VQAFFDALKDESSADSVWFRGVNNNMTRMIALRKAANCESFDHSAEEIYMEHIKAISAALLDGGRQQSGGGKAACRHDIVVTRHRRRHATTVSSDFFCVPFGGRANGRVCQQYLQRR
jgi:hypothetical protein